MQPELLQIRGRWIEISRLVPGVSPTYADALETFYDVLSVCGTVSVFRWSILHWAPCMPIISRRNLRSDPSPTERIPRGLTSFTGKWYGDLSDWDNTPLMRYFYAKS